MQLITFFGDSIAFSRNSFGIKYEDSYPYLLYKHLKKTEIIIRNVSGSTSDDTLKQINEYSNYFNFNSFKNKIAIINYGIVDCTPRPFNKLIRKIFSLTNFTNIVYLKLIKRK